jgi:hypothetical protein
MNRLLCLLAVIVLVSGAVAPAAASAKTVAATGGATSLREYAGTIVFSQFDQASSRWYLAVRRAGVSGVERLPVPPSIAPFAADIGPDDAGRPALIYQRCATTSPLIGCDLFTFSLVDGSVERPVRSANDARQNDLNPTLWRGRIAWTRDYDGVNPVVYTKRLSGGSARSRRVPGVPRSRCGDIERRCNPTPTTSRSVEALELRGKRLALVVRYECATCSGISQTELRLDNVRRRTSRQIAYQASGLSGQTLVGPSFYSGRLSWYKACLADEGGCARGGAFRYTLSTHRYARGSAGPIALYGYADTGSLLYEVIGCGESQPPPDTGCLIDEVMPPKYQATRPPR